MNDRRLAAILMADAVGFSAHAAADERGALAALSGCMETLERTAGLNAGRVVKTMGDGLMAEFGSVVSAVSAAAAKEAFQINPNITVARVNIIVSLHRLGRLGEAKEEARRMLEWNPNFSVEEFLRHSEHFEATYGQGTQVWSAIKEAFSESGP